MAALTSWVCVSGPDGTTVAFGPDSEHVPDWAKQQITNPDVWADGSPSPEPTTGTSRRQSAKRR